MQDQNIIRLIREGKSDKALVILYHHFPVIKKMIRSRGGNTEDAEDIFQESLIIFCRNARNPAFTLTARLSTYLFSVCRYLWKDELKRRNSTVSMDWETGLDKASEKELEEIIDNEARAKLVERILEETGNRCRELLLLFYHTGMKLKDIASRMGYGSESSAKNQKYKCLEGIKNRLKKINTATQSF